MMPATSRRSQWHFQRTVSAELKTQWPTVQGIDEQALSPLFAYSVSHLYYGPRLYLLICSRIITALWGGMISWRKREGPFSTYRNFFLLNCFNQRQQSSKGTSGQYGDRGYEAARKDLEIKVVSSEV